MNHAVIRSLVKKPLAITEEQTQTIHDDVVKKLNTSWSRFLTKLFFMERPMNLILPLWVFTIVFFESALIVAASLLTDDFHKLASFWVMAVSWAVCLGVVHHVHAQLHETAHALKPLSKCGTRACAEVVRLTEVSPAARTYRDEVIQAGRQLRMVHLQTLWELGADDLEAAEAREDAAARQAACHRAHGLSA